MSCDNDEEYAGLTRILVLFDFLTPEHTRRDNEDMKAQLDRLWKRFDAPLPPYITAMPEDKQASFSKKIKQRKKHCEGFIWRLTHMEQEEHFLAAIAPNISFSNRIPLVEKYLEEHRQRLKRMATFTKVSEALLESEEAWDKIQPFRNQSKEEPLGKLIVEFVSAD